jgi:hypothetical protein
MHSMEIQVKKHTSQASYVLEGRAERYVRGVYHGWYRIHIFAQNLWNKAKMLTTIFNNIIKHLEADDRNDKKAAMDASFIQFKEAC